MHDDHSHHSQKVPLLHGADWMRAPLQNSQPGKARNNRTQQQRYTLDLRLL